MRFRVGNKHMGNGQARNRVIVLLLLLGVLTNSLFAEICLCGEACSANPGLRTEGVMDLPVHMCCADILCMSCQMEAGERAKSVNTKGLRVHFGTFGNACPFAVLYTCSAPHPLHENAYLSGPEKILFPPIYLRNLTLIC